MYTAQSKNQSHRDAALRRSYIGKPGTAVQGLACEIPTGPEGTPRQTYPWLFESSFTILLTKAFASPKSINVWSI